MRLNCLSFLALQKEKELSICGVGSNQEMAAVGRMISEVPSCILGIGSYGPEVNINKNVKKDWRGEGRGEAFFKTTFTVTLTSNVCGF